jgi:DNA-binding protein HU-beta
MATRKKTGTLTSVGRTVKKAAKAVAQTADEYVVEPVGKALGLTGKKKPAKKKAATSTAKKPARKTTAKAATRTTAKKAPAKRGTAKTRGS